jgi:hypothetical protein
MFSVCVCVCVFFCVCVQVEALRWANHPSKESYRVSLIKKLRKLSSMLQNGSKLPRVGATRKKKEKKNCDYSPAAISWFRLSTLSPDRQWRQSCTPETALADNHVLAQVRCRLYVLLQNNVLLPQCSWLNFHLELKWKSDICATFLCPSWGMLPHFIKSRLDCSWGHAVA